ncbi:MBL fold metallo-hydrolase [Prevotella sp. MGM1]|uniref:MBL fold metallo-hydrolase n=1 Tax=Prevotella sp. MGM1 TaxID=2033405 RepID=UPI000CEA4C00|nr:MBL fold metallo-hydrolase [Prevotella sp. MGM1]GAY28540.1 metallo-beta-lactamase family protein [Prevotella sp. MGM1]
MLNFISFGSGSSGNCYYLYTATDGLLIDAGVGIRTLKKHFKDYGLSISKVRNILITHDHADHVKSVGCISHENNIHVYTTREVHQGIRRNYCVHHKINTEHVHYLQKSEELEIGEFRITPFEVPHDSADNVGYCIEHGNVVFCLITDAGLVTDEMKAYIRKANYLVIEANHDEEMVLNGAYPQYLKSRILSGKGHLSNSACAHALVENATENLKKVWLCHLSEENNHPELARKTIENILRASGIVVGKDFDMEILKRKTPTGIYELNNGHINELHII